jgi:hypothetical protein
MANEIRVRQNFTGGLLTAALTSSGTTLTSDGLAVLQVIDTTNHAVIVLDPDGINGEPEEVWVTAHTAAATTATISRGKGYPVTTARAHDIDIPWVHTAVNTDFYGAPGGYGLIGYKRYAAGTDTTWASTTSATFADVDATNGVVAFIGPPSGTVLVRLTCLNLGQATTAYAWNLRDGGGDIAGTKVYVQDFVGSITVSNARIVAGLTPGTSYSWKWGHARLSGAATPQIATGPGYGSAIMEVWAVNGA